MGRNYNNNRNRKKEEHRINYNIRARNVRLVGDNVENGVVDIKVAIGLAKKMELDLVEISFNKDTSICKVVDYKKFLYDKQKREKEQKKKQKLKQSEVKEIRMGPNTDDHDFNFKLANAKKFLTKGDKVLTTVFFKGRQISFKDRGEIILLRFAEELSEIGVAEYLPKMEGKKMSMMIKPKK
jgi:translation initiation factor IF-3